MRNDGLKTILAFSPEWCVVLAFCLLILPVRWVTAWVIAAAVHEVCHYAAVRVCSGQVLSVKVGLRGAIMETEPIENRRGVLCALAGPIGSILLIFLAKWLPRLAVCGFLQAVYNSLPIFPLDGGRALRCTLQTVLPAVWAVRIERWLKNCLLLILMALGFYATFILALGPLPILFAIIVWLKGENIKIPCKPGRERVQ